MFPTGAPASVRASFSSDGNAPPQNGETPCTLQEAFAVRDSALHAAGSFPAPGKAPRQTVCQKLHPFRQKIALRIGRGCLSLHRNKL